MNLLWLAALLLAPPTAPLGSSDFLADLAAYDGQPLLYEGEVIQDVMRRGDHVWLNVLDSGNAIGVWAKAELLPAELQSGDYFRQGDRLRIEGVLHTACPEHGGELDIHASRLHRVATAQPIAHPVPHARGLTAILALLLALGMAGLGARAERRRAAPRAE